MYTYDTETCGFHGPTILIQYTRNDKPIQIHSVFMSSIRDTLDLIEDMMSEGVIGFNLAFDHFHLCQTYTTLSILGDRVGYTEEPIDYIEDYALYEPEARDGPCLRPKHALDLMLHARKGPYQSTMDRGDIRIKRVPSVIAQQLADELSKRIPLKDIYFAKNKDKSRRWVAYDIHDDLGELVPDFKDLVLKFAPTSGLKSLAVDAGITSAESAYYIDIGVDAAFQPVEYGYAPFALAIGQPRHWNGAWPQVIRHHIDHWEYNDLARKYASDDVLYTKGLYDHFGRPPVDDDDSLLACMVGAVRWKGFKINRPAIGVLKAKQVKILGGYDFNHGSPEVCKKYLQQVMDDTEQLILQEGTKEAILDEVTKWTISEVCNDCQGVGCDKCDNGLAASDTPHPAAIRAREILDARHADKAINTYDKLLKANRFHADFKVIGTLSSRMSGSGGLNAQGIERSTENRSVFTLAGDSEVLCGGDFVAFEVNIMDAAYKDPILHAELLAGQKVHGLFGTLAFPPLTYDQILATAKLPGMKNLYVRSKNCVFALSYEGTAFTLQKRGGLTKELAEAAYDRWQKKYKVMSEAKRAVAESFQSMKQPKGLGSRVIWDEPADYAESMLGFKRYFTLENSICKALFDLAENPPEAWKQYKLKVTRRDREQTQIGALRTALFAAAFAIQGSNMRAAGNHKIQSTGASITKALQCRIWLLQPVGINPWRVRPLNVHDEIMCVVDSTDTVDGVTGVVEDFVKEYKAIVPLLGIEWHKSLGSWADK